MPTTNSAQRGCGSKTSWVSVIIGIEEVTRDARCAIAPHGVGQRRDRHARSRADWRVL